MSIPSAVAAMASLEGVSPNLGEFLTLITTFELDVLGATPSRIAQGPIVTVEDINAVVYATGVESSPRTMGLLNDMPSSRPLSSLLVVTRNDQPAISATSAYKRTAEVTWAEEVDSEMAA